MRDKKREDSSYEDNHVDDDEAAIDNVEKAASINKKQSKHDDLHWQEEESTITGNKKKKPNKPRKLNDALKDFQSNFGISSSSPSASTSTIPAAKAKATPVSSRQNGFKSSFGDANDNLRHATPARTGIATSHNTKTSSSKQLRPLNAASTPVKAVSSRLVPNFSNAPESHQKPLDRTADDEDDPIHAKVVKGKGRAIDSNDSAQTEEIAESDEQPHYVGIGASTATATAQTSSRRSGQVTSLLELSHKKQFKMPSTPSKPSPLSGRVINRLETPSSIDVKPLKSLGAISGLNALSHNTPSTSADNAQATTSNVKQDIKPKWAQLLETTTVEGKSSSSSKDTTAFDITELLSPRKKRKGWVPAGNAERASGIIKRLQTASNLWIHEISRTLSSLSSTSSSYSKSATTSSAVKKEYAHGEHNTSSGASGKKDYAILLKDLNPHLRLEIIQILSPKPASLTWSSQDEGPAGGGGFITAGAAEKLLITRCKILNDDATMNNAEEGEEGDSQATQHSSMEANSNTLMQLDSQSSEGIVIFSLAAHSRTSTGVSLVRKEQQRPSRDSHSTTDNESNPTDSRAYGQAQLSFHGGAGGQKEAQQQDKTKSKWTVFIPASIADLHTQLRTNDEVWIWEPWSVVDLFKPEDARSAMSVINYDKKTADEGDNNDADNERVQKATEKALLVSRFAVLL